MRGMYNLFPFNVVSAFFFCVSCNEFWKLFGTGIINLCFLMGNFDAGLNDTIMKSCHIVGGFFLYHNWIELLRCMIL
jgi:hypothetical protein